MKLLFSLRQRDFAVVDRDRVRVVNSLTGKTIWLEFRQDQRRLRVKTVTNALKNAGVFPETRWTTVFQARQREDAVAAQVALGEICQDYWFPLYLFARRKGLSPEAAEDATQDFVAHLLHEDLLAKPDPAQGRLRSFLLTVFERRLVDRSRTESRLKRGGAEAILSIDRLLAEERFEPASSRAPEAEFDRQWALALLEETLEAIAGEWEAAGQTSQFEALRPALDPTAAVSFAYDSTAAALNMTPAAVRQAVSRLRARFRVLLRQGIAETLVNPTNQTVDEELETLRLALSA